MNRKINVLGATYKIEEIKELHEIERHELIHAFLYECGLNDSSDWARNEELIDWLAIQFPKINVLFEKAGVTS